MQHFSSSDDYVDENSKNFEKENEKPTISVSFQCSLACFVKFRRTNFATGRMNREKCYAQLTKMSVNFKDCTQRSLLRSNTSFSAPFFAIFVKTHSTKRNDEVSISSLADAKPGLNVSESAFSASFILDAQNLLLKCVQQFFGSFAELPRAFWFG